jgi:hypothetical protein
MKKIISIVYTAFFFAVLSCSDDIFDNIKEYASEEKVYVGKFDKADVHVGLNRLEIDLMNVGRIPSNRINIGKAIQTIVEYDNQTYPCEGVQSWLNITGLTEPRLYRIKVYNIDEYGNKSIPVEAAAIPFTNGDVAALTVPIPQVLPGPLSLQLNWVNGLSSTFFDFYEMEYSYIDAQGVRQTDKSTNTKITLLNLTEGSSGKVDLTLKIVPKQNNIPILDVVYIESAIDYKLLTIAQYLSTRNSRKIKSTAIDGNTVTVTWGDITEQLAISELAYETESGVVNTVRVSARETTVQCPAVKAGELYKTRSGFVPSGSVDTLYKDWAVSGEPLLSAR